MKWWLKAMFLLGLLMAAGFAFAVTALADDCSGIVDCYGVGTAAAAAATAVGIGAIAWAGAAASGTGGAGVQGWRAGKTGLPGSKDDPNRPTDPRDPYGALRRPGESLAHFLSRAWDDTKNQRFYKGPRTPGNGAPIG